MPDDEFLDPLAAKRQRPIGINRGSYYLRQRERANGTKARLITQHKGPNTDPTPGADYKGQSSTDLKKAFDETHAHAISQWQAANGVMGTTGSEDWFPFVNNPTDSAYEENQKFAYQHDMQATDADLQAKTPKERKKYNKAIRKSALKGFWVLKTEGDHNKAMKKSQKIFKKYGFTVRENY